MRKLTNNKSGFTLLEIIVVLIILGVLASVALPNLFKNISKSKGAEALASLSTMRSNVEGCTQGHPGQEDICANIALNSSPNFAYAFTTPPAAGNPDWTITATGQAPLNGTVVLTRTGGANPNIVCTGTVDFSGVC